MNPIIKLRDFLKLKGYSYESIELICYDVVKLQESNFICVDELVNGAIILIDDMNRLSNEISTMVEVVEQMKMEEVPRKKKNSFIEAKMNKNKPRWQR